MPQKIAIEVALANSPSTLCLHALPFAQSTSQAGGIQPHSFDPDSSSDEKNKDFHGSTRSVSGCFIIVAEKGDFGLSASNLSILKLQVFIWRGTKEEKEVLAKSINVIIVTKK